MTQIKDDQSLYLVACGWPWWQEAPSPVKPPVPRVCKGGTLAVSLKAGRGSIARLALKTSSRVGTTSGWRD